MSNFLHQRIHLREGVIAILDCDTQCNFMLLDDYNFRRYKESDSHNYFGGFFEYFPAKIAVPHDDYWNVVIDLGGGSANIRHSLSFIGN